VSVLSHSLDDLSLTSTVVHELRTFFEYMITAPTDTVQPAIDLAALALCKTDSPQSDSKSTTLDTEPGNGLGSIEGMTVIGPMLPPNDTEDPAIIKAADSVMGDDKSDTSMQAMDLRDDGKLSDSAAHTQPAPPNRPPPVPPRPAQQAKSKLGNIEESARQQDAAEVLSNIFDLISCAIKGTDVLRENEQFDIVKELFFSDVTSVRNTKPKQEQSNELRDHFLVSPGWRDRNIYATLDDDFGLSEMEGGITKFDFIEKAAPVQIINLRRLQYDRTKGEQVYDRSHIGLEQILYLDRYLKETRSLPGSELLKLREAQWEKQRQLRDFDERRAELGNTEIEDMDLPDIMEESSNFIKDLIREPVPEGGDSLPTPPAALADFLQDKANELKTELKNINSKINRLESEMDDVFRDARDWPYRLHAIFTHRGGTKGGHYWIYIYDFQNELWRRYNDDKVELVSSTDIFERESGSMPSASTGVVYIRKDLVHQLTEAVRREPAIEEEPITNGHVQTQTNDVQMPDADEDMPPLEPVTYNDVHVIHGVEKE
jgi:ubiquitin carboxyl-terminal hydrolase 25/28